MARFDDAGGRNDGQRTHHFVEPPVAGGILSRRARRRVAADGGVGEGLREVPEGPALLREQLLGLGAGQTGSQRHLTGDLVEVLHPAEAPEIQRNDGGEFTADGIHAADDGRAAAEGNDGHSALRAQFEDLEHLVLVRGGDARVGGGHDVAGPPLEQVEIGLAAGTAHTLIAVRRHRGGTDDGLQRLPVGVGKRRVGQPHVVELRPGSGIRVDAQHRRQQAARAVAEGARLIGGAPQERMHGRGDDGVHGSRHGHATNSNPRP